MTIADIRRRRRAGGARISRPRSSTSEANANRKGAIAALEAALAEKESH